MNYRRFTRFLWSTKEGAVIGFLFGYFVAYPLLRYFGVGGLDGLEQSMLDTGKGVADYVMRNSDVIKIAEVKVRLLFAVVAMFVGALVDVYFTRRRSL